jgi:hypothetical protein
MAGVLAAVPSDSLAVLLPLGVIVYGAVLFAVGGVDRRALEVLRP